MALGETTIRKLQLVFILIIPLVTSLILIPKDLYIFTSDQRFFTVAVSLIIGAGSLFFGSKKKELDLGLGSLLFISFVLLCFLSTIWAFGKATSIYIASTYLLLLIFVFQIKIFNPTSKELLTAFLAISALGLINSATYISTLIYSGYSNRLINFKLSSALAAPLVYFHVNYTSILFTMTIPFSLLVIKRVKSFKIKVVAALSIVLCSILVLSLTCQIAILVLLFYLLGGILINYFWNRKLVLRYALIFVGVIFLFLIFNYFNYGGIKNIPIIREFYGLDDRFVMWDNSIQYYFQNSFLGVGIGNWSHMISDFQIDRYDFDFYFRKVYFQSPHNLYISLLTEIGIIGLLLFLIKFLAPAISLFRKKDTDKTGLNMLLILAGFLAISLSDGSVYTHRVFYFPGMLFVFYWAYAIFTRGERVIFSFKSTYAMIMLFSVSAILGLWFNFHRSTNKKGVHLIKKGIKDDETALAIEGLYNPIFKTKLGRKHIAKVLTNYYQNQGKFSKAIEMNEKVLAEYPNSFKSNLDMGKLLVELGGPKNALEYEAKARKINPLNYELRLLNAKIYKNLNMTDEALEYLDFESELKSKIKFFKKIKKEEKYTNAERIEKNRNRLAREVKALRRKKRENRKRFKNKK